MQEFENDFLPQEVSDAPRIVKPFGVDGEWLTSLDIEDARGSIYPSITNKNDRTGDRD